MVVRPNWRLSVSGAALTLSLEGFARAQSEPVAEDELTRAKTEFTPAPIVGGNSDIGFGGGAIVSVARLLPNRDPYLYRIELATTTTFKLEQGHLRVPFQDNYVMLSLPHVVPRRLQLDLRASYTHETTSKYYGIGNAATVPANQSLDDPFFEYDRTHATGRMQGTLHLSGPLSFELWIAYTHNWLEVPAQSKLAEDTHSDNSTVKTLITTFEPHGVVKFSYGLVFDTRDGEVSPRRGQFFATRVDLSPGGTTVVPQRWGAWNTNLRWYFPLGSDGSTIAVRTVADLLFGDPPFYELTRFDDTGALGGPDGVRGVPAQRYGGLIKLLGNIELRKMLFDLHFFGKRNHFGIALFADGGRVFATYESHPELDGTSVGLKFGLGGGLRLVAGRSFVMRADVAWSPDARPVGLYLASGQIF